MWQLLKKIPVPGLVIGAFIICGLGYLGVMKIAALSNSPAAVLKRLFTSESSKSFNYVLDGAWRGELADGMPTADLKTHIVGGMQNDSGTDTNLQGTGFVALTINQSPLFMANGEIRAIDKKVYMNLSSLVATILGETKPENVVNKWFALVSKDQPAGLPVDSSMMKDVKEAFNIAKVLNSAEDLGTETIDGTEVRVLQLHFDKQMMKDIAAKGNTITRKRGGKTIDSSQIEKLGSGIEKGVLTLKITSNGNLYSAEWKNKEASDKPFLFSIQLSKFNELVTVESPATAIPVEQFMTLLKAGTGTPAKPAVKK
ncbi:MAG: hypothetical protein WCJ29_06430 [bacterium]